MPKTFEPEAPNFVKDCLSAVEMYRGSIAFGYAAYYVARYFDSKGLLDVAMSLMVSDKFLLINYAPPVFLAILLMHVCLAYNKSQSTLWKNRFWLLADKLSSLHAMCGMIRYKTLFTTVGVMSGALLEGLLLNQVTTYHTLRLIFPTVTGITCFLMLMVTLDNFAGQIAIRLKSAK